MKQLFFLVLLVSILAAQVSWSAIPETMSYQGRLTDGSGNAVADGNYSLTFNIYDVSAGGSALWTETHGAVATVNGIFNVILGSNDALNIAFDKQYWLGIKVGGGAELTPRIQLTSSPYSLSGWRLTGNAGTSPPTNFLGTTDNTPLELWVNSLRALRLEPHVTSPNIISGFNGNWITSGIYGATIAGGGSLNNLNRVTDGYGVVGGGIDNQAGNGDANTTNAQYATVGGGVNNEATEYAATVGGGAGNEATGNYATVGGGLSNDATDVYATVGGGLTNKATGEHATVGGGRYNEATGEHATVGGGRVNQATAAYATVSGGGPSNLSDVYNTNNTATDDYCTVGGGGNNRAGDANGDTQDAVFATVGGGYDNQATGKGSTIAGGGYSIPGEWAPGNRASGSLSTVGGGTWNGASGNVSFVGGGSLNSASGRWSTVGGGFNHSASSKGSTISGGTSNRVTDDYGTIGGGESNQAGNNTGTKEDATHATVAGGENNTASGFYSTIPGGRSNTAQGYYSFAAGRMARANHRGSFVWGDAHHEAVESTGDNRFIVRAMGGVYLYTNSALSSGMYLSGGGSSWNVVSDRAMKRNIRQVNGKEILSKLAQIPISQWSYKAQDPSIEHIGPMAQDFYAAFGLGEDDKHINTLDPDGVALAAIQGLYELVQKKEADNVALKRQVAVQQGQMAELEARLATLESLISKHIQK